MLDETSNEENMNNQFDNEREALFSKDRNFFSGAVNQDYKKKPQTFQSKLLQKLSSFVFSTSNIRTVLWLNLVHTVCTCCLFAHYVYQNSCWMRGDTEGCITLHKSLFALLFLVTSIVTLFSSFVCHLIPKRLGIIPSICCWSLNFSMFGLCCASVSMFYCCGRTYGIEMVASMGCLAYGQSIIHATKNMYDTFSFVRKNEKLTQQL